MQGIFFKPWIGKNYETGGIFPKRIIILGESHYIYNNYEQRNEDLTKNLTIECIEEQIIGEWTHRFWTQIAMTFLNRHLSLEDKINFWQSVGFYNYIQEPIIGGPRIRPTKEMWLKSQGGFRTLININKPQFILVCGIELWRNLPDEGVQGPIIEGANQEDTWLFPLNNSKKALAYGILHPSSGGFSSKYWHPFVAKAVKLA
jgi:hypothetical protein